MTSLRNNKIAIAHCIAALNQISVKGTLPTPVDKNFVVISHDKTRIHVELCQRARHYLRRFDLCVHPILGTRHGDVASAMYGGTVRVDTVNGKQGLRILHV